MAIEKGNKVKIEYTGTFDDGTVFDSSEGKDPIEFTVGEGNVIKGFEDAVIGMELNEEKNITIEAKDAYGESKEELIKKIPIEQFPSEPKPEPGMLLALGTAEGRKIAGKILEVSNKEVTVDLNHPLAGKTLHFKVKVVEIN